MIRAECRKAKTVQTPDARFFMGGTLDVRLLKDRKGCWRVTVWGPDDIGVETKGDLDTCLTTWGKIHDDTSLAQLRALGFKNAF